MKLAYWMYAGPAHIGTLRVASSFRNVHAIMHAPLGDDYFNVMRSMLERERDFTPVTASIVDRHVLARGSQEKVVENIQRKDKEECPDLILLTPTCTSSILQEDLQNFVNRAAEVAKRSDVLLADVNHYRVNELQAADRTLEQIVRFYLEKEVNKLHAELGGLKKPLRFAQRTQKPSANILGMFTLGFHNQHDCRELKRLLNDLGIEVNEVIPEGSFVHGLKNLPKAWFNIVPYREVGLMTAIYLEKEFGMPYTSITPMGIIDTAAFIREIAAICSQISTSQASTNSTEGLQRGENVSLTETNSIIFNKAKYEQYINQQTHFVSQAAWFSRSIDCQNLTGKKTVVFGDATHAASMTKILVREMGIHVVCAGTYCKHDADWFREQVSGFCDQVLITDDHSQIAEIIAQIEPAAIFGTQMERHVGKRLDIPCGVISAPVHIQNFPLGFRPFLGYEGTNQISDLVYNSFSLGMEDHLLEIFNGHDNKEVITRSYSSETDLEWTKEALDELARVPGFVRSKVKRNTEKFARTNKNQVITIEVMYAAKEAVSA
uniref:Light-independent protochlorophyllide reductase subunit B n=1 Tax=Chlamydomonas leiostraca TaxID=1034604 RepID=A0A1L2M5F0_9CHLO|nr:photochlorophyllide reductase subunit B [Chlamydomonas leiostraca]APD80651.1 photochlorophyllide reductase subunit B [Chlamydomonas leiostraca]